MQVKMEKEKHNYPPRPTTFNILVCFFEIFFSTLNARFCIYICMWAIDYYFLVNVIKQNFSVL